MSKKAQQEEVIPTIEEKYISISTMFGGKDLLKDGANLNTKLNSDNHYYQHVHRLSYTKKNLLFFEFTLPVFVLFIFSSC